MKKLLITSLIGIGVLLPANFFAATNYTSSSTEMSFSKGKKKKKSVRRKKGGAKRSRGNTSRGCTYNGHELFVGPRGGCYYYSGSSKEYVERAYCSGCN